MVGPRCDVEPTVPTGFIVVNGETQPCVTGSTPEEVTGTDKPKRCVFAFEPSLSQRCTLQADPVGSNLRLNCRFQRIQRRTTESLLPPDLRQALPYAVSLDLSGWQPMDGVDVVTALEELGVTAKMLRELNLANTGLQSLHPVWNMLAVLAVNLPVLTLDISNNPAIQLPPQLAKSVGTLLVSTDMVPVPESGPSAPTASATGTDLSPALANASVCAVTRMPTPDATFHLCAAGNGSGCVTCSPGEYLYFDDDGQPTCRPCAAGGFFQDEAARIGSHSHCACQHCGEGTFSPTAGAQRPSDCRKCPIGTNSSAPAGYRACPCLPGFYRRGRFELCLDCSSIEGIECMADVRVLKPGYWWGFRDDEALRRYNGFVADLLREDSGTIGTTFDG